ncbi:MAG: AAA family ATPase [Limnobacter sp.]|uniref:AAA family ATPase n=1 Tax=Limnobacter sp. TaxID=2003368 RepID=UPI00391B492E
MSRRRFSDDSDKGGRFFSDAISSRGFSDTDQDSISSEYGYLGAANILVPRKRKDETLKKLRGLERDRFVKQLTSPDFQQDLWDFVASEEFEYLKKKWRKNSEGNACSAYPDQNDNAEEDQVLKDLHNAEELTAPKDSETFVSHVKACMSDLEQHCVRYEGMIRSFTAQSALTFAEEIGEDSDRIARAWRTFVPMTRFNGFRKILRQSTALEQRLKRLRMHYPNFSEVVDHIIEQLRVWPLKHKDEQRLKPINLNGPKGTGKSAFAKALAEALETRYEYVNIAATSMAGVLTGLSNKWGNGQAGLIFSSMARSDTASPVILLDEIEKAERGSQYPVEGALLALLEPQTSREFRDEFGNLQFDASRIIYVATSNDANLISDPLKSRFDSFEISYPNRSQREVIICNMLRKSYLNTRFTQAAISLMASQDVDLRNLQSLLDKVVRRHVSNVLNQMGSVSGNASDDTKEDHAAKNVNEGGSSSLLGEQVIDEATVRLCLHDMGRKAKAHFGFVGV